MSGQEEVGSYLCLLLLDECINEIKDYLTKKTHDERDEKSRKLPNGRVSFSLHIISITSYLLKLTVVSINYVYPYEISYQTLIYFS